MEYKYIIHLKRTTEDGTVVRSVHWCLPYRSADAEDLGTHSFELPAQAAEYQGLLKVIAERSRSDGT